MSRERARGTAAESAVCRYLREHGFPHAERRAGSGRLDRGDVAGLPGVVIEVKACARTELASWLDECAVETRNDNADVGAVWHKRRGRGDPGEWFVTMSGATFISLVHHYLGTDHPA